MAAVTRAMESHGTTRRGIPEVHRDQAIVERFNHHLAEQLSGHKYAVEMCLPAGQRARMWVKRLSKFVAVLNGRVTWLTGQKPVDAIKERTVYALPSTAPYRRPVQATERTLPSDVEVRSMLALGELEGGTRRAIDPNWSLETFELARVMGKQGQPVLASRRSETQLCPRRIESCPSQY